MSTRVRAVTVAIGWLAASWFPFASTAAADPMRPLTAATPPSTGYAPAPRALAAPAVPREAAAAGDPAVAAGAALRATRRGADGRWQALVGDRWIATGDRLGEARVAGVDADRVRLTLGSTVHTLHLLPPLAPARRPWPSPGDAPARPTLP